MINEIIEHYKILGEIGGRGKGAVFANQGHAGRRFVGDEVFSKPLLVAVWLG